MLPHFYSIFLSITGQPVTLLGEDEVVYIPRGNGGLTGFFHEGASFQVGFYNAAEYVERGSQATK